MMNRFDICSVPLLVKCRITCLCVTLRERARKRFESFLMAWLDGAARQAVFSVDCNSDSEMLTTLQTTV